MQKKTEAGGKKHAREDNLWPSRWKNIVNHDLRLFLLFEEILNVSVGSQVSQFAAPNALIRTMWKTQYFYCPPFLYISSWGKKWLLSKSGLTTIYECWLNSLCNNGQAHHKTTTIILPINTRRCRWCHSIHVSGWKSLDIMKYQVWEGVCNLKYFVDTCFKAI